MEKERNEMEKDILEEIKKECKIKKEDKVLIKVLINICKYYKIKDIKQIVKSYKEKLRT